jgi:hypothetical protein
MKLRRRTQPIPTGHLDVEQGHVRPMLTDSRYDVVAACDLCYHVDVLLDGEQGGQRLADHGLVFGQQHPDHLDGGMKRLHVGMWWRPGRDRH